MTKDVLVSITGLHNDFLWQDGDTEPIEMITPAAYYFKNGKHYILYEEIVEGEPETIRSRIKITGDDMLEIMKTGAANAHMIFEKNKKNLTYYGTSQGQLLIGVDTRNMQIDVTDQKIDVKIDYLLDVNHEPLADCRIRMHITSREDGVSLSRPAGN